MNSEENDEPELGLSFIRLMPLSWQLSDADAGSLKEEQQRMRNERLFQLLLLYDEYPIDRRDEEMEHASELDRVEAKLDAVIQLLAILIAERNSGSGERLVTVAAHHLQWIEDKMTSPADGDRLQICLEVDPRLPQPLKMTARVVQLKPVAADGIRVRVKLEDQGERIQQALEKLIVHHKV